jgi:hypothetical protein
MTNTLTAPGWNKKDTQSFWSETASSHHLVQIYEHDDILLDCLEGFVSSGLNTGESVIIIATKEHTEALASRLADKGFDLIKLYKDKQFILLDAEETLSRFMVVGWPDENKFNAVVQEIINQARGNTNRKVRAYGEMVALLWSQGYSGATIQLEQLWNKFCAKEKFCLFCAYPKKGFTYDVHKNIGHVCSTHTKIISGEHRSLTEVHYKDL